MTDSYTNFTLSVQNFCNDEKGVERDAYRKAQNCEPLPVLLEKRSVCRVFSAVNQKEFWSCHWNNFRFISLNHIVFYCLA